MDFNHGMRPRPPPANAPKASHSKGIRRNGKIPYGRLDVHAYFVPKKAAAAGTRYTHGFATDTPAHGCKTRFPEALSRCVRGRTPGGVPHMNGRLPEQAKWHRKNFCKESPAVDRRGHAMHVRPLSALLARIHSRRKVSCEKSLMRSTSGDVADVRRANRVGGRAMRIAPDACRSCARGACRFAMVAEANCRRPSRGRRWRPLRAGHRISGRDGDGATPASGAPASHRPR